MSKSGTASVCVLIAGPLLGLSLSGSSALAAACTIAPVSTYTASGFSCSVGPVTFSDINVTPTTSGEGVVTLSNFVPFSIDGEFGLDLTYSSTTNLSGGTADVAWTYNVSGVPDLVDTRASLAGGTTGSSAQINLSEVLSNGTTLSLSSAGVKTATFAPVGALHVIKDQEDFASAGSAAFSSIEGNAFSVVPEPSTWAMLLLGFAGLGLVSYKRARKLRAAG
jgi:PEP-CTERM motif